MESGGGATEWSSVEIDPHQQLMKKIFSNLGVLVLGFGIWLAFDYFSIQADASLDPNSLWPWSQLLGLLFPAAIFVTNWYVWRDVSSRTRALICVGMALGLSVLEYGLIFYIGFPIHLAVGGFE